MHTSLAPLLACLVATAVAAGCSSSSRAPATCSSVPSSGYCQISASASPGQDSVCGLGIATIVPLGDSPSVTLPAGASATGCTRQVDGCRSSYSCSGDAGLAEGEIDFNSEGVVSGTLSFPRQGVLCHYTVEPTSCAASDAGSDE